MAKLPSKEQAAALDACMESSYLGHTEPCFTHKVCQVRHDINDCQLCLTAGAMQCRWAKPCGWVVIVWTIITTCAFCIPLQYPVTFENNNYAAIATVLLVLAVWSGWVFSARHWFLGPTSGICSSDAVKVRAGQTLTTQSMCKLRWTQPCSDCIPSRCMQRCMIAVMVPDLNWSADHSSLS